MRIFVEILEFVDILTSLKEGFHFQSRYQVINEKGILIPSNLDVVQWSNASWLDVFVGF
jgi:hypothetical protein